MATDNKLFAVYSFSMPLEIESLSCFGDNVFIGTRNGHLLTYLVKESAKVELKLLKHDHNFSSQKIIQMDIAQFRDGALLFSLSNNVIRTCKIDLPIPDNNVYSSYTMVVCSQTKGASSFAINKKKSADNSSVQICVAIEKKLRLYKWNRDVLQPNRKFIELNSTPTQIVWYKNSICIGFSTGIAIYDVSP